MSDFELEINTDVPAELYEILEEIGYTEEEEENEIQKVKDTLNSIYLDFISSSAKERDEMTANIDVYRDESIRLLRAIGTPENLIAPLNSAYQEGTISERYRAAKNDLVSNKEKYDHILNEFEQCKNQVDKLYEKLGIPVFERKEFAKIDENILTTDKMDEWKLQISCLEDVIDQRSQTWNSLVNQIHILTAEMNEIIPKKIKRIIHNSILSEDHISALSNFVETLCGMKEENSSILSALGVEMVRLWDLLQVPESDREQFLKDHQALSRENVMECIDERDRLLERRNEKIDILIEATKVEIQKMCKILNYDEASEKAVFDRINEEYSKINLEKINYTKATKKILDEEETEDEQIDDKVQTFLGEEALVSPHSSPEKSGDFPKEEEENPKENVLNEEDKIRNENIHKDEEMKKEKTKIEDRTDSSNIQRSEFQISIIEGRNVPQITEIEKGNLFIEISSQNQESKKTIVIENSSTPIWNQSYVYPLSVQELHFELFESNFSDQQHSIGSASLSIEELNNPIDIWLELHSHTENAQKEVTEMNEPCQLHVQVHKLFSECNDISPMKLQETTNPMEKESPEKKSEEIINENEQEEEDQQNEIRNESLGKIDEGKEEETKIEIENQNDGQTEPEMIQENEQHKTKSSFEEEFQNEYEYQFRYDDPFEEQNDNMYQDPHIEEEEIEHQNEIMKEEEKNEEEETEKEEKIEECDQKIDQNNDEEKEIKLNQEPSKEKVTKCIPVDETMITNLDLEEEEINYEEDEEAEIKRKVDLFNVLDSELLHLKKIHVIAMPIIELIEQREAIIKEYNDMMNSQKPENKKTTKAKSSKSTKAKSSKNTKLIELGMEKQQTLKDMRKKQRDERLESANKSLLMDKISRRHKCVLPRIEKKLKLQLIEFKEEDGEDFMWGGTPYIEKIPDIKLSQSEIDNAKMGARRKSSSRRKSTLSFFPMKQEKVKEKEHIEKSNTNKEKSNRRHTIAPQKISNESIKSSRRTKQRYSSQPTK